MLKTSLLLGRHSASQPALSRTSSLSLLRISPNIQRQARLRHHKPHHRAAPWIATATATTQVALEQNSNPAPASPSPGNESGKSSSSKKKRKPRVKLLEAEQESLELLGWPELCKQVACFCKTPMGAQRAMRGRLPVGSSREESELLYRQTREAQGAPLDFSGVYDMRRALDAAAAGQGLHPLVLGAFATTLAAARRLREVVLEGGDGMQALRGLTESIDDALPELQAAIEKCININEGWILDSATPELSSIREERRQNADALRRAAEEWSRSLHNTGAAERPQVVVRRDRQCIPVKAGRQGELPKGSVMLATSASGNTFYMEPAPLVTLNNSVAALAAAEKEEEERILGELSAVVSKEEKTLRRVLGAVGGLDIACARARHGAWIGGVEPLLHDVSSATTGTVHILRALHPLLLGPSLSALPTPPLPEISLSALDAMSSGPMAAVNLVPELLSRVAPQPTPAMPSRGKQKQLLNSQKESKNNRISNSTNSNSSSSAATQRSGPVPVDLIVPPGKSVVAVTGPNTGGKTASLKTLGLLSLMAKAGLFIPVQDAALMGKEGLSKENEGAAEEQGGIEELPQQQQQPSIAWFDRVLADVGDGQSLQQSLSTFSGHVRRLRGVLREATPGSLVLLDEVGSGTDPGEGAALAAALLTRLADGRAALTYATTHHAELKEVASTHPAFVNASVEFDVATLRPTYRLMWGLAGESNALAVAQGLGFDPRVVEDARVTAAQLQEGLEAAADRAISMKESLEEQHGEVSKAVVVAGRRRQAAEAALREAEKELDALRQEQQAPPVVSSKKKSSTTTTKKVDSAEVVAATREIQDLVIDVKAGRLDAGDAAAKLRALEQQAQSANAAAMTLAGMKLGGDLQGGAGEYTPAEQGWAPKQGESVRVMKMGGALGVVASSGGSGGGKVTVRVGSLMMEVRTTDLAPASLNTPINTTSSSTGDDSSSSSNGSTKKKAQGNLKPQGGSGGSAAAGTSSPQLGVAIQTSTNTVEMRGMTPDDAVAKLEVAVSDARPGTVLFAVHGVGTGRVRAAVKEAMKRHPSVAKVEEEEGSHGGCSVLYLHR